MLTLLTATGCRPEAWALCQRWMERQDYTGSVRWVIVDDGETSQQIQFHRPGWQLEIIRPSPFWREGENTQSRNLLAGLSVIDPGEQVVIVEDDDWYAAGWLSKVGQQLRAADLVGEMRARYYNVVSQRARQLNNLYHSSLCSTAMKGEALSVFRACCKSAQKYIDLELWAMVKNRHLFDGHLVLGIKGLPGRGGIGFGHGADFSGERDRTGKILRQWIGDDAEAYL